MGMPRIAQGAMRLPVPQGNPRRVAVQVAFTVSMPILTQGPRERHLLARTGG